MANRAQHADPAGTNPAGPPVPRGSGAVSLIGASWLRFRAWRRSRPFWAGIFLLVAGAELLLIPLPMDSLGLIVHIGIGGISGILIGAVLMVAGLLLWFHPVQRMFYSIVAVLLAIAALVASNLGGFLIGTILGVVGGSLGFAWTPLPAGATPRRLWRRRSPTMPAGAATELVRPAGSEVVPEPDDSTADTSADVQASADAASDETSATVTAATAADPGWGRLDPSWGAAGSGGGAAAPRSSQGYAEPVSRGTLRYSRSASRHRLGRGTVIGGNIFAIILSLLTFGLINLSPTPSPTQAADPPAAAATPTPSASPSASPSAGATASPGTSPSASAAPVASPTATGSPIPTPTPTGSSPQFAIASAQSTLTASSASLAGFRYDGVVSVPTATGTVEMMQFSASSLDLSGVNLAVSQGGATITTTASSLDFNGNVVLYATKLSGDLLGIPTTLTPGNVLSSILQLLGQLGLTQSLTQAIPLTMTNVTTLQPYTSADGMTANALQIS